MRTALKRKRVEADSRAMGRHRTPDRLRRCHRRRPAVFKRAGPPVELRDMSWFPTRIRDAGTGYLRIAAEPAGLCRPQFYRRGRALETKHARLQICGWSVKIPLPYAAKGGDQHWSSLVDARRPPL